MERHHQTVTLRPAPNVVAADWRGRIASLPTAAIVGLTTLAAASILRQPALSSWAFPIGAVLLIFGLPNLVARLNARIWIAPDTVTYQGVWRHRVVVERSSIEQAIRVRLAVLGPRFCFSRLLLLDGRGRALASIQEEWWPAQEIDRLGSTLGVPVTAIEEVLSTKIAARRFPGSVSFALKHRVAIGVVTSCLVLVVLLGILGAMQHKT